MVHLSSLDLGKWVAGGPRPFKDLNIESKPITIGGKRFEHGLGVYAPNKMYVDLARGSERFEALVGVDDASQDTISGVEFRIYGDGKLLWKSGIMKAGEPARKVEVNLHGIGLFLLRVVRIEEGKANILADWAEARFEASGGQPRSIRCPVETPVILTPKPGSEPRINGPKVYGCRPGNPFLYRIAATGKRPMRFTARDLPENLVLNQDSGIISGSVVRAGQYVVKLHAANDHGQAEREFKIVCGDQLALTPPMGWNHWYIHEDRVTDAIIREAADIMLSSGMADVGYDYVCIDGCWTNLLPDLPKAQTYPDKLRIGPPRDAEGNILPNRYFPDMKALADYIHAKGFKAGIYSSPGPVDCAGFAAAYQHEAQDARQYAQWGFDLLKYDWCSYGKVVKGDTSLPTLKKPYKLMGDLLKQQKRDIIFSLCQYGLGNAWEWGGEVGGHCWRTAGDLSWNLDQFYEVALKNATYGQYSKPGSWNDPDFIMIGYISDWRNEAKPEPAPLTPNEQYAFVSLWSLMAVPLIFTGDMTRLDEFTLNVLCNTEVIEVNQDPLGQCGRVQMLGEDTFAMVKEMEDGSRAVGLFNRGELPVTVSVKWSDLNIPAPRRARDLWRQKDVSEYAPQFGGEIPRRGCAMLRLWSK